MKRIQKPSWNLADVDGPGRDLRASSYPKDCTSGRHPRDNVRVAGHSRRRPRVLVACEFSGIVRDAFRCRGLDAWSCDLLPCEGNPKWHILGDVRDQLDGGWDLMIAHPPCQYLAVNGARWFQEPGRQALQRRALAFVRELLAAPIPRIALENPVSIISSRIRRPDQTIQPWQFGHGEVKRTCLWLKNLPLLRATRVVRGRAARVHQMPPSPDRWRERSRTYTGVAAAMAKQWGALLCQ